MGSGKSGTGIKILDDTVNGVTKGLGIQDGIQHFGSEFSKALKNPGEALGALGKNVERNVANDTQALMAMFRPGGFNNIGQTLMRSSISGAGGAMTMTPEEQKNLVGETNVERAQSEAEAKAKDDATVQALNDIASLAAERDRQVQSTISGAINSKKITPGKRLTLLSGEDTSNTLLKISKGKI